MSRRAMLTALVAITLFWGTAEWASAGSTQCTPGYCIDITIDLAKGEINPVPDIWVPKGSHDIHIHWRLPRGQNRHSFRQDHIKLKNNEDNADNAFDQQAPEDEQTYHWHNKNPKAKAYYYEINVYDAITKKVIHLDPIIHNDG